MPGALVARLNHTLMELIGEEKVRQRLADIGVVVRGSTAAEFGAFMAEEFKRWDEVREAAGIAQQ
jgi:tripartite-type tricarboxylate transporter receptor subunit TctC